MSTYNSNNIEFKYLQGDICVLFLKVLILLLKVIGKILVIVFFPKRIEFTSISRGGGVFVFVNVKKNKLKIFRNGNLINPNTSWKLFIYLQGGGD